MSNWTGIAAPLSELSDFLQREEVLNPGICFLTGTDPDSSKSALYIGEHSAKDFGTDIIAFVSKDETSQRHIRYLKGKLIEISQEMSGATLMNVFSGKVSKPFPVLGATHFYKKAENPIP